MRARAMPLVVAAAAALRAPAFARRAPRTARYLNRIMLTEDEASQRPLVFAPDDRRGGRAATGVRSVPRPRYASSPPRRAARSHRRAAHVRDIIWRKKTPEPDASLRVGCVDGGQGDAPARLEGRSVVLEPPPGLTDEAAPRPRLDVVLALPAPLRLKRTAAARRTLPADYLKGPK